MQDETTVTAGDVLAGDEHPAGEWLAPAAAASRLGVSERTLWRLVKAGRYHRRVEDRKATILVPGTVPLPDTGATLGEAIVPDTMIAPVSGTLSGVTDTSILAVVDEMRRQSEASLDLIARQAETIGQLRAELEAERRAHSPVAPDLTPQPPVSASDTRLDRWRVLTPWLLSVLAMIAVVALLVWPR